MVCISRGVLVDNCPLEDFGINHRILDKGEVKMDLTQEEVIKLLQSLNEPITPQQKANIEHFFKNDRKEIEEMEVISQAEIDALLGRTEDTPNEDVPEHIERGHRNNQTFIKAARQQILRIMDTTDEEGHKLLHFIQVLEEEGEENESYGDLLNTQRLLGDYYEFLNECHAKLNCLDDLARRETTIYQRRVKLGV